jgi:Flp pilus assembly protein TadG
LRRIRDQTTSIDLEGQIGEHADARRRELRRPGDRGMKIQLNRDEPMGRAERGQVLILFAVFLVGMVGMMALSVDLGVSFTERRAMQNAADAGALAGARVVLKSTSASPLSASSAVSTAANANAMRIGSINQINCSYVDDSDTPLGDCSGVVPSTATGVTVTVQETHSTFFIRAIPGGPTTAQVSAKATAHVLLLKPPTDGPFLPCANAALAGNTNSTTPIVIKDSSGRWVINPAAVGVNFYIHGPQINRCGLTDSSYKGIADQTANAGKTIGSSGTWLGFVTGTVAGPISVSVDGANGCVAGQVIDKCVVFLPIVVNNPPPDKSTLTMWGVAFAPFYITQPNANEHDGVLLANYVVYGKGQNASGGWFAGYTGPTVIRLTS